MVVVTDTIFSEPAAISANRNYQVHVYESNLFNTDVHPISGVATSGLHTRVRKLTKARSRVLDLTLNRPGSFSFTVPLTSADAAALAGQEIKRSVIVFVDDEDGNPMPAWSGPIYSIEYDGPNVALNITCVGWLQLLHGREFRQKAIFSQIDAGIIGTRILGTANNQVADDAVLTDGSTAAEDLLFGDGECDSMLKLTATGVHDTNFPAISTDWASSGSGSLSLSSTNQNNTGYVQIGERFEAVSGEDYQVRGWVNVSTQSGTAATRLAMEFFDSNGDSLGILLGSDTQSTVVEKLVTETITAATGAVQGAVLVSVSSGASGAIEAQWDAILCAKNEVKVWPTGIELGTVDSPANPDGADRSFTWDAGSKMGQALENLSEIESGVDFEVATVKENPSGLPGGETFRRYLNIRWALVKADTTIRGIGQDRADVVFGYRRLKKNVKGFVQRSDSSKLGNRVNARTEGRHAMAQDLASIAEIGLWEDSVAISDTNVSDDALLGFAGAEVIYRSRPILLHDITPFPYSGTRRTYRFKVDFDLGDIVYGVADHGVLQVGLDPEVGKQPIRIFGLKVNITDAGSEVIDTFQATAS